MNVTCSTRGNILFVKTTGVFSYAEAKAFLPKYIEIALSRHLERVLFDLRSLEGFNTGDTSTLERFDLSRFVAETVPPHFRFSILETPRQIARDGFGENVMVNRGASVKVTADLDEALAWLGQTNAKAAVSA
jgi:hypothetical protein